MNEDYKELVEYLDVKFTKIDERFIKIDEEFVDLKSQIFDLDKKIVDLQENKADKADINNLLNSVDKYAQKAGAYFQEMVMLPTKLIATRNVCSSWLAS